VLAPAAFLAAIPWRKAINQSSAIGLTVALVIFVLGYSNYLAYRQQRGLDEVQKAGVRSLHNGARRPDKPRSRYSWCCRRFRTSRPPSSASSRPIPE
jgi:hypothetical protein